MSYASISTACGAPTASVRSMEGIAAELLKMNTAIQVRKHVTGRLCEPDQQPGVNVLGEGHMLGAGSASPPITRPLPPMHYAP
jgi:hypothetical protein